MARTFTAAERAAVAALRHGAFSKFEVQDADLVYRDYTQYLRTDWFTGARIARNIDSNTWSLNATLLRETGTLSLSPFVAASLVNRNAGGTYATAIDAWRKWKLSVAVMREGYPPTGTDWKELCTGRIDIIEWSGDLIQITGRGEEAVLLDFYIATEQQYGSGGGTAQETVLQSMSDNNLRALSPTLYTPVSPGFNMLTWTQPKGNLFPAQVAVASKSGSVLEFCHDASDVNRLTLFKPNRPATPGSEVWTLGPSEYTSVDRVAIDKSGIRNFIKLRYAHPTLGTQTVIYPHMAGTGTVACVAGAATFSSSQAGIIKALADNSNTEIIVAGIAYTVTGFNGTTGATLLSQLQTGGVPTFGATAFTLHDTLSGAGTTVSLSRFGRIDMELDLAFDTQVTDPTNAQAMCDVVGSDMEFPDLEQTIKTRGAWFVQLYDYGKFEANPQLYDSAQYGGVTSIEHNVTDGTIETTLGIRGKPQGAYSQWRQLARDTAPLDGAGSQITVPLLCRVKTQSTTATQVVFRVAVSDPFPLGDITLTYTGTGVGTIAPASPRTLTRANLTNNIDTTGTVDITVDRAAFGSGTGRITFTASAASRISSSDAGEVPTLDRDTQGASVRITRISETTSQVVVRVEAITPNAAATATVNYDNGGLTVSPATGGTFSATTSFGTTGHIDFTITRDTQGGSPRRVAFTVTAPGSVDGTDGVDVPPNSNRNRCHLVMTGTGTQTSGTTPTVITILTEGSGGTDVGGLHDDVTNPSRITIPTGGGGRPWFFSASVGFQFNATGDRYVEIRKNGTGVRIVCLPSTKTASNSTVIPIYLFDPSPTATDYYEIAIWQNSGSTLNISAGSTETCFDACDFFA